MPMQNMSVSCIERLSLYPLHHGGLCKDYSYSPEIISCSMLTDNDECIRVYNRRTDACYATLLPIFEDVIELATF